MSCSALVEDQRMELPFILSAASPSPSLDIEAALHHLSNTCEPLHAESSSSSEDPDVLMMDPSLDYINALLMEEGMEDDATCMQQDADASYQAIVSSFYEIIGEHSSLNSSVNSTSSEPEDMCDVRIPRQISSCYEEGPGEHHIKVSSLGEDAVVEGPISHRSCSGKEQGNGPFKLPTTDEEFTLKLTDIDISFEDLKLESDYTALYVEEPSFLSSTTRPARISGHNGDKKKSLAVASKSSRKSGNKGTAEEQCFVDLSEVLVSCAQAVAAGDVRRANEFLQELRQVHGASSKGSGFQRTAHYFGEALVARMKGTGGHLSRIMNRNMPSTATLLKVAKVGFEVTPYLKTMHYFANQSILKAAEGASRLHIVDYGIWHGIQWPFLIQALADRQGGPPLLVITGIEFPQLSNKPAQRLEETGRRLAAYATTHNVPFEYHAIADSKWEALDPASFHLHEDEVLVVNCMQRLRHFTDESIDLSLTTSPRQKVLSCMRNLNPHLLLFADLSATYDSPFFVRRFREALYFYSSAFDMTDILWDDSPEKLIIERNYFYWGIVNVVACEGADRVERPESYKQWQMRIKRAGFDKLPIPPTVLSILRSYVKRHYHKNFDIHDANGWLLLGWKGRVAYAMSVWKPSPMYRGNQLAGADAPHSANLM